MNEPRINIRKGKKTYKEHLKNSGLGIMGLKSGHVSDTKKAYAEKNRTMDYVVTSNNKKDGKSYLNLSKGEKARLINHLQSRKDCSIHRKSFSKKMSETHSLVNLKTRDSNELIGFVNKNNNCNIRAATIYANNFNFFLKNSNSNSYRTDINQVCLYIFSSQILWFKKNFPY